MLLCCAKTLSISVMTWSSHQLHIFRHCTVHHPIMAFIIYQLITRFVRVILLGYSCIMGSNRVHALYMSHKVSPSSSVCVCFMLYHVACTATFGATAGRIQSSPTGQHTGSSKSGSGKSNNDCAICGPESCTAVGS